MVSVSSYGNAMTSKKRQSTPVARILFVLVAASIVSVCLWANVMFFVPVPSHTDCSAPSLMPPVSTSTETSNDSSTATVMGMASGYGLDVYKRYVGSLRNTGYKGNIILIIAAEPAEGVEAYLASKGVVMKKLKTVPCDTAFMDEEKITNGHQKEMATCADPYPDVKIRWGRFPLLRDYLQECKACTGPVLISDVRDTFFQRDPFGDGAPVVRGLQIFEEYKFQRTTHWLFSIPVGKCKGLQLDETMLCSGTTIGTREAMLQYLDIMYEEMKAWMKDPKCCCNEMNGDDQSIHNYLFYTGKFPFAAAITNRMGIVHTVGHQATLIFRAHEATLKRDYPHNYTDRMAYDIPFSTGETWLGPDYDLVDEEGYFLDYDGGRSRVVHQYDRFRSQITKWLDEHIGDK